MRKKYCFGLVIMLFSISLFSQEIDEIEIINNNVESGNIYTAIQSAKKLLATDSLSAELWYELGKLQRRVQKYNQAAASFSNAYKLDSSNLVFLYAKAKTSYLAGKKTAAVSDYKSLLKKDTAHVPALLNLASFYNKSEDYSKAFHLYKKLHFIDSLNSEYLRKMAVCKMKLKEINPAFNYLRKAYSIDSANINVVSILSKVYTNMKKYDSALMIVDKAISMYPNEGELYALRGYTHFKRNHHYRSIPDYEKAIELGIFSIGTARYRLGASLFAVERFEDAKEVLEKLLFPDTVDHKVCIYLGNIYNELGDPDKGIVFLNKSLELQAPEELSMSSTYRGLQACYHKKGLYYKEIEMIKLRHEALKERYYSDRYMLEIAEVYEVNLNNKPTALKYYEKFYAGIKDWYPEESKNKIEIKINRLKEDIHFEK
jgi:tetratricopeptide (TPR) repeat protein